MRLGKVKERRVLGPVNGAKDILGTGFCLDLELEGAILGRFTRKVDIVNFIETNVNWGLKELVSIIQQKLRGVTLWRYIKPRSSGKRTPICAL